MSIITCSSVSLLSDKNRDETKILYGLNLNT